MSRSSLKDATLSMAEEECAFRLVLPYEQVRFFDINISLKYIYIYILFVSYPFPLLQDVIVVFDHQYARDQFQESLAKTLAYCDNRRLRTLPAESLDFQAKENFSSVGQKKFKGSTYAKSFFGNDFVDWVEKKEGCPRERGVQVRCCFYLFLIYFLFFVSCFLFWNLLIYFFFLKIGQNFIESGVVVPCELKKSHGEFHDKAFPYRFIWDTRDVQLAALKFEFYLFVLFY